jgi:hypothetical protein
MTTAAPARRVDCGGRTGSGRDSGCVGADPLWDPRPKWGIGLCEPALLLAKAGRTEPRRSWESVSPSISYVTWEQRAWARRQKALSGAAPRPFDAGSSAP